MSAIARRYARAAVLAAEEDGGSAAVDTLSGGLRAFRDAYQDSQELREVVLNPALTEERTRVFGALFESLDVGPHADILLRLLAERDRIAILDALVIEVESIADERAGRLRAYIAAPIKLTQPQQKRIAKALEKRFGRPILIATEVDPDMLGGLVCRVGDTTLDYSVRRQLELLRQQLEGSHT